MTRHDPSVDMLARRLVRHTDAHVRVPLQQPAYVRQAVIRHVNFGAAQVHIQLGGSDQIIPNVSYVQAYSPLHLPRIGHTCQVLTVDKDLWVIGQHIASTVETI